MLFRSNMTARGPTKRKQAGELLQRLRSKFAPGALLFHGQGKWYPGEQLPRWAFGCYWRPDGEPLWEDQSLFADMDRDYGFSSESARAFITRLAERLGVDAEHCLPGYEDAWYHLWRERQLPVNVDPLQNKLEDPEERRRLSKVFEQGLKHVVGYTLPLRRGETAWESCQWSLRHEHLFLIPGDSSMFYGGLLTALAQDT